MNSGQTAYDGRDDLSCKLMQIHALLWLEICVHYQPKKLRTAALIRQLMSQNIKAECPSVSLSRGVPFCVTPISVGALYSVTGGFPIK